MCDLMIVLGIDPGTASTGYGVVAASGRGCSLLAGGVIETAAGVALERRLAEIHQRIGELLEGHRPEALAIEELYFGANVRTAFAVGQARGVVLLAAGQRGIPSRSYTPQQVKGGGVRQRPRRQGPGRPDGGAAAGAAPPRPRPTTPPMRWRSPICDAQPLAARRGRSRRASA